MQADLYDLYGRKEIFWDLQEIARENSRILEVGSFFDWMCRNYITAQAVSVRRFLDQDRNSHSLWRLLYELLEHPKSITRVDHVKMYRTTPIGESLGQRSFDSVVGKSRTHLGAAAIRSDLKRLEDASDRIRRFVNKRIAHFTQRGSIRKLPRLNDLDSALEVVDKLFHKYDLLLTGRGGDTSHATRQYDWREALWEPWVPKGSKFRPDA
ncbi:MAG: hypothetical protein ACREQZ_13705 [Woeseiaceae bacterium]